MSGSGLRRPSFRDGEKGSNHIDILPACGDGAPAPLLRWGTSPNGGWALASRVTTHKLYAIVGDVLRLLRGRWAFVRCVIVRNFRREQRAALRSDQAVRLA